MRARGMIWEPKLVRQMRQTNICTRKRKYTGASHSIGWGGILGARLLKRKKEWSDLDPFYVIQKEETKMLLESDGQ